MEVWMLREFLVKQLSLERCTFSNNDTNPLMQTVKPLPLQTLTKISLTLTGPHDDQLDHNAKFTTGLLIDGGVNTFVNCPWEISGERSVWRCQRKCLRGHVQIPSRNGTREIFLLSIFNKNKITKNTTYFVIEKFIPGRFIVPEWT